MTRLGPRRQRGITLIELLVAMAITVLVGLMAYGFYHKWMGQMTRQKMVEALQGNLREATQSVNRYLVSGGVGGDSLFFDPHRVLAEDWMDGGHSVFRVGDDSASLTVYGNFTGQVTRVAAPMMFTGDRALTVEKPEVLQGQSYAYITAGSTQEVARITSVGKDGLVRFAHDTWIPYPKGTLVFPIERVVIRLVGETRETRLEVRREAADGKLVFLRSFSASGYPGDSASFRVTGLNRLAGQVNYSLGFSARTKGFKPVTLERKAEQTVMVRGF